MSLLTRMDPLTRKRTTVERDGAGRVVIQSRQDVQPVVDVAKALYANTSAYGPSRWKGDQHWVATIPMPILMQLYREGRLNDSKDLLKWLDDPDNRVFRCMPGRLSR